MKAFIPKILLGALLALSLGLGANATPITGDITFTGDIKLNNANFSMATGVTSFSNTKVNQADGSFGGWVASGDAVSFTAPWMFNSGAVSPFWQVDGFTFNLTGSFITFRDGDAISVKGSGWVMGHGFDVTAGTWLFSTQNVAANGMFSFSASSMARSPVSENGTTALLIGSVLVGLSLLPRRKSA
ncbi:MAG: hypothetical protein ABIZ04_03840 [Opitutus sp.]